MTNNNNKNNLFYKPTKLKNRATELEYLYSFDDVLQSRIANCGKISIVSRYLNTLDMLEKNVLEQCSMCETKFCPLCNFYRALRYSHSIEQTLIEFNEQGYIFLFMTLTVPNCNYEDLDTTLKKMSYAFNSGLMKTKEFKQFKGYIRTTELTFHKSNGQAHPHYHIILIADKNYSKKSNHLYINNKAPYRDLSKMWYKYFNSCIYNKNKNKFEFDFSILEPTENGLITSIMPIKQKQYMSNGVRQYKDKIRSAVDEVAKYITKSNDLKNITPADMCIIHNQLKGKRFISSSSNIKLNRFKVERAKDNDLIQLIERFLYMYNRKERAYIFQKMISNDVNIPNTIELSDSYTGECENFEKGYIHGSMQAIKKQIKNSRKGD